MTQHKYQTATKNLFVLAAIIALLVMGCDNGSSSDNDTASDNSGDSDADTDTDADTDSDTDSDTNGGGDFPGNCACAARFDFDGEQVDICSNDVSTCLCMIESSGSKVSCYFFDGSNRVNFLNFAVEDVFAGATCASKNDRNATMTSTISDVGYAVPTYDVYFDKWDGIGGVASGTFEGEVTQDHTEYLVISNGQFYAPISEE
ncbi:MAG: hypothetical protein JXX14_24035 [Deltaproteobacteria bacterium]|nr:hypothetical protein [Deltaproteobacteria bacterium]